MLYVSVEDFYRQVADLPRLTREQEVDCARRMALGDTAARDRLVVSYLPQVASTLRRSPATVQTLHAVYAAVASLEQGVDSFNFLQEGETFTHHLSWRLRQVITRCIADSR